MAVAALQCLQRLAANLGAAGTIVGPAGMMSHWLWHDNRLHMQSRWSMLRGSKKFHGRGVLAVTGLLRLSLSASETCCLL